MSRANIANLTELERACLEHLRQAQEQGLSFAKYCRQRNLRANAWYWTKQRLVRKGVIAGRQIVEAKPAAFVPVCITPKAPTTTACRIRHPSGWVIECDSFPQAQWLSVLMSGAAS
jgi:hypothetical protein